MERNHGWKGLGLQLIYGGKTNQSIPQYNSLGFFVECEPKAL